MLAGTPAWRKPSRGACLILLFCLIGVWSEAGHAPDLWVLLAFGLLGYLMKKFGYEPAPLVLAFVLGRLAESPCGSRCCSPAAASRSWSSGRSPRSSAA
jgi:hypothetical protein